MAKIFVERHEICNVLAHGKESSDDRYDAPIVSAHVSNGSSSGGEVSIYFQSCNVQRLEILGGDGHQTCAVGHTVEGKFGIAFSGGDG